MLFFNLTLLLVSWFGLHLVKSDNTLPAHLPSRLGDWNLERVVSRGEHSLLVQATKEESQGKGQALVKFILKDQISLARFEETIRISQTLQQLLKGSVDLFGVVKEWGKYRIYLFDYLEEAIPLSELFDLKVDVKSLCKQLANEVLIMKQANIAHRDIKPSNILLYQGQPFLIDFDISVDLSTTKSVKLEGTEDYMPPELEVLMYTGKDEFDSLNGLTLAELLPKGDVFALGLVFAQLLTGMRYTPRVKDDPFYVLRVDLNDEAFEQIPPLIMEVLTGMLDSNPKTRWSIDQVVQSGWLS